MSSPAHLNTLLDWYRFRSGEYSRAEQRGLATPLDIRVATPQRHEYDAQWKREFALREKRRRLRALRLMASMKGEEQAQAGAKDMGMGKGKGKGKQRDVGYGYGCG